MSIYSFLFLVLVSLFSVTFVMSTSTFNVTLLTHSHVKDTWYGSVTLGLQALDDPVMMVSTWVYPPVEIHAFRPNNPGNGWIFNTTNDFRFQTLMVASTGTITTNNSTIVDSVIYWLEKPQGPNGNCTLIGFNSAYRPVVPNPSSSFSSEATGITWITNLPAPCLNVNSWVPFTTFDISQSLTTAAAWVLTPSGTYQIYVLDAQTGAIKWTKEFSVPIFDEQEFVSYGIKVSPSGNWVIYDDGIEGLTDHFYYIYSAENGTLRDIIPSSSHVQTGISYDGEYVFTVGTGGLIDITVHSFDENSNEYVEIGVGNVIPPVDTDAYYFMQGTFTIDTVKNRTLVGGVWFSTTLDGNGVAAVFDVAQLEKGPIAQYNFTGIPGNGIAFDGAAIDCKNTLCVIGLQCQVVNGTKPTVIVLDVSGEPGDMTPPIFTYITPGSMNSVAIVQGKSKVTNNDVYYIAAGGCDTYGVCIAPGADAYIWEVAY